MPLISGLTSAILNYNSQRDTNAENREINNQNNAFNSWEAQKQRNWQTEQDAITREFNATEAQKVRDFEERMANTSYQRAFEDAKAAGINPVAALLGKGGADTPTVAAASGSAGNAVAGRASSPLGMKAANFDSLAHISDGLAQVASSAASLATIKKMGTIKNVADVSKILTNARTARAIGSLAKLLV